MIESPKSPDYYRLNVLETLLSQGSVVLSVVRESECSRDYVLVEPVNGKSCSGRSLRDALDEMRNFK